MEVKGAPIYTVLKWNAVATRVTQFTGKDCSICKEGLEKQCPVCSLANDATIKCLTAKGQCYHTFHRHCLQRWLEKNKKQTCPLCLKTWNDI